MFTYVIKASSAYSSAISVITLLYVLNSDTYSSTCRIWPRGHQEGQLCAFLGRRRKMTPTFLKMGLLFFSLKWGEPPRMKKTMRRSLWDYMNVRFYGSKLFGGFGSSECHISVKVLLFLSLHLSICIHPYLSLRHYISLHVYIYIFYYISTFFYTYTCKFLFISTSLYMYTSIDISTSLTVPLYLNIPILISTFFLFSLQCI